jgi:hypothetical protein
MSPLIRLRTARDQLWRTLYFRQFIASRNSECILREGQCFLQPCVSKGYVREYTSSPDLKKAKQGLSHVVRTTSTWQKEGNGRQQNKREIVNGRKENLLLDIATAKNTGRSISKKAVEMELAWLKDPMELARRVARLLSGGEPGIAATLVREAQGRRIECAVAWNHLMQYCMNQGAPLAAFKFYNDVRDKPELRLLTFLMTCLLTSYR